MSDEQEATHEVDANTREIHYQYKLVITEYKDSIGIVAISVEATDGAPTTKVTEDDAPASLIVLSGLLHALNDSNSSGPPPGTKLS